VSDGVKAPEVSELDETPGEVSVTIRGVHYKFRELTIGEYEKLLKMAEGPNGRTDNVLLLKLMVKEAMVEPKRTLEEQAKTPMPVARRLNDIVNEMHFTDIETDEEKADRDKRDKTTELAVKDGLLNEETDDDQGEAAGPPVM
jgi:hypothetical protein